MRLLTSVASVFILCVLELSLASGFTQCYYPDGSIPTDYIWEPCTGSKFSSCCVPSEGDVCQPDGLCYFPDTELVYRGACTDRTWNDPSCNANICVTGFETTWTWALTCDAEGDDSYSCGQLDSYGAHETPNCSANAIPVTTGFVSTRSTSTAGRYTPPPSVDTKVFSVYTSSYTTTLTAKAQTTTLTSTFASTFTSKIGVAAASFSPTSSIGSFNTSVVTTKPNIGAVTLSIGALIGIIVGCILLLSIALGTAVILFRKHRSKKLEEDAALDSPPPPNGPVGRDQVHPYEVPNSEVAGAYNKRYNYVGPKVDTYEIDDRNIHSRGEKQGFGEGGNGEVAELRSPSTPAPSYGEALMPVELDASPNARRTNREHWRQA